MNSYFEEQDYDTYLNSLTLNVIDDDVIENALKTVSTVIKQHELSGADVDVKQIDLISRKAMDYRTKQFTYLPEITEMKFINSLEQNEYISTSKIGKGDETLDEIIDRDEIKLLCNNSVVYGTTKMYKKVDHESESMILPIERKKNFDFLSELCNNEFPKNSVLTYDTTKSLNTASNPNYLKTINYFIQQPIKKSVSDYFNKYSKFIGCYNHYIRNVKYTEHVSKEKGMVYKNVLKVKQTYNVLKLPKELLQIIRHINYYFNDIKSQLVLNDKTGYYYLSHKDMVIPVMCKHIYMTMNKNSLQEISKECYYKGQCKFCGDSLTTYEDEDTSSIPSSIAEMIFKLMKVVNVSDDDIFLGLYNMFSEVIRSFVESDSKDYENQAAGIVSLFVYKIILLMLDQSIVTRDNKYVNDVILSVNDYCSTIGWTESNITQLLSNETLFRNVQRFINVLLDKHEGADVEDVMEIIFEQHSSDDLKKMKESGMMDDYNNGLRKLILNIFKYDYLIPNIESVENTKLETNVEKIERVGFNTFKLFSEISLSYCPEGVVHDWKNGVCNKCKLRDDNSNVTDIYDRYEQLFNSSFDMKPVSNLGKIEVTDSYVVVERVLKEIEMNSAKEYIKNKLGINNLEWDNVINNIYLVEDGIRLVIKNKTLITLEQMEKLSLDDILKLIMYLDENHIDEFVIETLKYPILKPHIYIRN